MLVACWAVMMRVMIEILLPEMFWKTLLRYGTNLYLIVWKCLVACICLASATCRWLDYFVHHCFLMRFSLRAHVYSESTSLSVCSCAARSSDANICGSCFGSTASYTCSIFQDQDKLKNVLLCCCWGTDELVLHALQCYTVCQKEFLQGNTASGITHNMRNNMQHLIIIEVSQQWQHMRRYGLFCLLQVCCLQDAARRQHTCQHMKEATSVM